MNIKEWLIIRVFLDTSVILNPYFDINLYSKIYLSIVSVEEIDNLKSDERVGYLARQSIRNIMNANNVEIVLDFKNYISIPYLVHKNDNIILRMAYQVYKEDPEVVLISDDYNMIIKARGLGLPCRMFEFDKRDLEIYKGYKEVTLSDIELASFYENPTNQFGLLVNEYLLIKDAKGNIVDKKKWTEKGFKTISTKPFKSIYFPDFKPRDEYQMMAMDSLINDDLTLLYGRAGSCKTYMSLSWIMQNIHNGKLSKCVIIFNPAKLKNNDQLGFYPGSRSEKLMSTSLGGILSSKFGDITLVESLIANGKLMLIPTCDIRGIEISDQDCIYLTEGQNTDAYTMRTIIQRAKEKCKIIIEGDMLEQQDIKINNIRESGMYRTIEVFKGTQYFSCVELQKIYRSPLAELAQNI